MTNKTEPAEVRSNDGLGGCAAAPVDLRKIAERAGISMDCWDMGAASMAYSEGCHGITRAHLEKFAANYGFACWNAARDLDLQIRAALEAPPPAERVPLTDAQILALSSDLYDGTLTNPLIQFARAIEAAHGIKPPNAGHQRTP